MGLGRGAFTQEVPRQNGVGKREQLLQRPPLPRRGLWEGMVREALEHHVQLLHAAAAAPQEPPRLTVERGRGRSGLGRTSGDHVQLCRSMSIFLISTIARAGFRSFGHTSVQFMIVWQR
jgi:hypothetical protein